MLLRIVLYYWGGTLSPSHLPPPQTSPHQFICVFARMPSGPPSMQRILSRSTLPYGQLHLHPLIHLDAISRPVRISQSSPYTFTLPNLQSVVCFSSPTSSSTPAHPPYPPAPHPCEWPHSPPTDWWVEVGGNCTSNWRGGWVGWVAPPRPSLLRLWSCPLHFGLDGPRCHQEGHLCGEPGRQAQTQSVCNTEVGAAVGEG